MKKLLSISIVTLFLLTACFQSNTQAPEPAAPIPTPAPAPAPQPAPAQKPSPTPPPPAVKLEAQIISIEAGNVFFKPKSLTVKINQPVTVNFTNKGSHTFTIDELGVNSPLRQTSGSFTFTPTKTGTFTYYCSVPGHRAAGQFGTITVIE